MTFKAPFAATCAAILGLICANAFADAVYLTSATANSVVRVGANGAKSTYTGANLSAPAGLVFDASGNLYVSNGDGSIKMFPADGGDFVSMATGQNGPTGLAIGPDGILYAAIAGDNKIVKIAEPGVPTLFANLSNGSNPQGIAFDDDGNLLVAVKNVNLIRKFSPNGNAHQDDPIGAGDLSNPVGVLPAGANNIVVAHAGNGGEVVNVKLKGNGNPTAVASQLGTPTGLAIDSIGNYYVGTTEGVVKKIAGKDNAVTLATEIAGIGQLVTRAAQFNLVAFKNEMLTEPLDARFASLGSPIIGEGGSVAHPGKLLAGENGITSANDTGIWKTDPAGTRVLVAREGQPAPNAAGADSSAIFAGFSDPVVNGLGRIAFRGTLRPGVGGVTASSASGLWAEGASGHALVAQQGGQPPGLETGAKFTAFQQFVLPDAGGLVFLAKVSGTGVTAATNFGLWAVDGAGVAQLAVRKGDPVSVNGVDKKIAAITLFSKVPFSAGQTRSFATDGGLLFRATFTDGSTALVSKEFGTSTLNVVTYKNEVITAEEINGAKLKAAIGAVNQDLSVAYRGTLSGGSVASSNNQAIFLESTGGLGVVARKSFTAPNTDGAIFNGFSDPVINDLGEVAFRATLKGTGGLNVAGKASGLWLGDAGSLSLVARQGDVPSGAPSDVRFTSFPQFCVPANGGLVFLANLGGNVTTATNQGVWLRDAAGSLDLLLRKGDTLDVDGSNRKVSSIVAFKTSPYCGAQARNVSNDGQVTLLLKFVDGSQAIYRITQP